MVLQNFSSATLSHDFSLPLPVPEHLEITATVSMPERTELDERRATPEPLRVVACCGGLPSGLKMLRIDVSKVEGWARVGYALPESLSAGLGSLVVDADCLADSDPDSLVHLTDLAELRLSQYPCSYDSYAGQPVDRKVILVNNSEVAYALSNAGHGLDTGYFILGQDEV